MVEGRVEWVWWTGNLVLLSTDTLSRYSCLVCSLVAEMWHFSMSIRKHECAQKVVLEGGDLEKKVRKEIVPVLPEQQVRWIQGAFEVRIHSFKVSRFDEDDRCLPSSIFHHPRYSNITTSNLTERYDLQSFDLDHAVANDCRVGLLQQQYCCWHSDLSRGKSGVSSQTALNTSLSTSFTSSIRALPSTSSTTTPSLPNSETFLSIIASCGRKSRRERHEAVKGSSHLSDN